MVSTRGLRSRFTEGERVLCYEPDPSKAKVLYESKVLQVVHTKDSRGRTKIEYLIHFQGWNASWDRCVDEDLVLKDTDENRDLQTRLMEEAQLKLKEKKKKRRLSDTIREIVQENQRKERGSDSCSQPGTTDDDESASLTSETSSIGSIAASSLGGGRGRRDSSLPDESNAVNDPNIATEELYLKDYPLELPPSLKIVLERDFHMIKDKQKLLRLPSIPDVLTMLEEYVVFFAARYASRAGERRRSDTRQRDRAYLTLRLCQEVMDGLRVCFDYHCRSHLLYDEEKRQADLLATAAHASDGKILDKPFDKKLKEEIQPTSRRLTRSGGTRNIPTDDSTPTLTTSESGRSTPVTVSSLESAAGVRGRPSWVSGTPGSSVVAMLGPQLAHDLAHWTLLPEDHRDPGTPVLIYGPLHLLRLLVKMPEILFRMNLAAEKRKAVIRHLQLFIEYLDLHNQEFFPESQYVASSGMAA